jgi:hypothetical protein
MVLVARERLVRNRCDGQLVYDFGLLVLVQQPQWKYWYRRATAHYRLPHHDLLAAAYLAPATNASTLIDFFRKVRPAGPGWDHIRRAAGISAAEARVSEDHIPLALLGWVSGCAMIWSALFAVGNCLYGRETMAALLFAVFLLSGWVVIFAFKRLWSNRKES